MEHDITVTEAYDIEFLPELRKKIVKERKKVKQGVFF